jgi:uncharacterized protein DUF5681
MMASKPRFRYLSDAHMSNTATIKLPYSHRNLRPKGGARAMGAMTAMEKYVLVDSLEKQQGRDAQGRFTKGRSGNPKGRFVKGQSGNPKGRPPGARNKATETAELLLDGETEALTRMAIELALDGNPTALRLCLERIIPPRRERPVQLGLAPVRGAADLGGTMAAITNVAGQGAITPGEAADLARVVEIFVRAVEASDFERRLKQLEEGHAAGA